MGVTKSGLSIVSWERIRPWLGLALGGVTLALSLRGVRLAEAVEVVVRADYFLLSLALGAVVATTLAKAARWEGLLGPQRSGLRLTKLLTALLVGQMTNALLPGRLGEVARVYLVGELEGVEVALAFGTVITEKFLDSAALLLLVVGLLPWIHLPPWLRQGAGILGLVSAALMVLLILASYGGEKLRYGMDRLAGWVPWAERLELVRWLDGLLRGLKLLGKPNVLGRALVWSGLIWALAAVTNYLVMEALRIEAPSVAAVLLLAALHLSVILPTTPTQLGVFHYVCVLSLSLFGVPREPALGYGFALHLVVYVPMISLGALCLWREGIDLRRGERAR